MKKLNQDQIKNLYSFTKQHKVDWYDLQSELVDHLANDMENIWEKEPNLSFENVKEKAFMKFGKSGFTKVIEKKIETLGKRYRKLIWKEFIQFFSIPKIVITIILFFAILFILRLIKHNTLVVVLLWLSVMAVPLYHMIKSLKVVKQKSTGKKWLFEEYIANLGNLSFLIQIPFQILITFSFTNMRSMWSLNIELIFTTVFVIFGLFLYIAIYIIPPKVRTKLSKQYPEYQIN